MGRAHVENEKSALSLRRQAGSAPLKILRFPRARRSFHYTEKRFWLLAPPSASASVAAVTAAELRLEIYDRNWRVGQIGHVGHVEPIISRNGMLYQDHGCQRFHNGERELVANNTEIKILH